MTTERDIIQLPTPLHERTAEQSRTNAWGSWNGFTVPLVFGTESEEARVIARHAGLADFSPQPVTRVAGPDASARLDRLLTRRVSDLGEGETRTALLCAGSGHVIDKCTVARLGAEDYLLISDSSLGVRLTDTLSGGDVSVTLNDDALIGVVGAARDMVLMTTGLNAMTGDEGFVRTMSVRGIDVTLIDLPDAQMTLIRAAKDDAGLMWNRFLKKQDETGVMPVGLKALERFRIDQGRPRAGYEFEPATTARSSGSAAFPAELGWANLVDQDGRAFAGAHALKDPPEGRALVQIEIPRAFDLRGGRLVQGDRVLGRVTSAYMAPEHSLARGLALMKRPDAVDGIKVEISNGILTPEIKFLS